MRLRVSARSVLIEMAVVSGLMWVWKWLPAAVFLGLFFLVLQMSFGLVIAHVHASAAASRPPGLPADADVPEAPESWLDEARVRNVLVSR